jgi:cell division protein FtsX
VIINQTMARRFFPTGRAVGHRIRFYGRPDTTWVVVGVVGDVRVGELDAAVPPTVYTALSQNPANRMSVVIRSDRASAGVVGDLRRLAAELDALIPVYQAQSLEERVAGSEPVFLRRFPMLLIGSFAAASLLLAVVGLYGLVAQTVGQRQREFGIRLALGATAGRIARSVQVDALRLAGAGIAIGIALAAAVSGFLRAVLFGVQPLDTVTYIGATLLVVVVALAASAGPAIRAARVQPARVLTVD